MTLPANLFWTHAEGDSTTLPCTHIVRQHPAGDTTMVPCVHLVQDHPGGDPNPIHGLPNIPCIHVHQQHPGGDAVVTPCIHLVPQHPAGDPGPDIPCLHPMPVVRAVPELFLVFYTDDATIQNETIAAAKRLKQLGVTMGSPLRPLNIFNRPAVRGNADDATDPFWSHYEPLAHAIQITQRPGPLDLARLRDTLHHEMGHATLGHSLVQVTNRGAVHSLTAPTDPGEAMSEGWAHFVALAIRFTPDEPNPPYSGMQWGVRDAAVARRPDIEYNVGCMLWDLLDRTAEPAVTGQPGFDNLAMSFTELYRVYSPSLQTIPDGPIIPDVANYLRRLERNNPAIRPRIEAVRQLNGC
jgi:hypothetical protein